MTDENNTDPLKTFELTWAEGRTEQVKAHFVVTELPVISFRVRPDYSDVLVVRADAILSIRLKVDEVR